MCRYEGGALLHEVLCIEHWLRSMGAKCGREVGFRLVLWNVLENAAVPFLFAEQILSHCGVHVVPCLGRPQPCGRDKVRWGSEVSLRGPSVLF